MDVELRALNPLLPPLIVQPFVENAILHGMKEKGADGHIRIKFYAENAHLLVEVSDNGPGLRNTTDTSVGKISMGRNITSRRLELINQQDAQKPDISKL